MSAEQPALDELGVTLRRESTAEQTAAALRGLIVSGRIAPGTFLREGPLAKQLAVSRNTIHEATQILVSQGLVTREIQRGAYVSTPGVADVHDLYRARRLVETLAVGEAARAKDLTALRRSIEQLEAAVSSRDVASIVDADFAAHRTLVDAIDSERLRSLFDAVEGETRLCVALVEEPDVELGKALLADHRAILRALERGNVGTARTRLAKHLDASERRLAGQVAERSGGTS